MTLEKPKGITITIGDRKENKFKSFVVYDMELEDVGKRIKKVFEK